MIKVGVMGATGYTGVEMVRVLLGHPKIEITFVTSEKNAGASFSAVFPAFQGIFDQTLISSEQASLHSSASVVFLCLPHHSSMKAAAEWRQKAVKVIDLSADFRLKSAQEYEEWYGKHEFPELLSQAVYGLPELYREKIKNADLVANPGCYPTSAALALAPLIQKKLVHLESIIVDSKSGVSGAGRSAEVANLFSEVNEGFKAYKVASHRHTPEIEQTLSDLAGEKVRITFTPHLVPMDRGIFTTVYATPTQKIKTSELTQAFQEFYQGEKFIRIESMGRYPNTREVRATNFCDLACVVDERAGRIIVLSVIDNLTKGAAGQALQNFNLMMGLEETMGLKLLPHVP